MATIFSPSLAVQRYCYIQSFLEQHPNISSITDVGCGNGRMLNWTKAAPEVERINCIDTDAYLLEDQMDHYFRPNLHDMLFGRKGSRKPVEINVFQGDIAVPDDRLKADCFTLVEMIEHITLEHVENVCRTIFCYYRPATVVVTTPNTEFNPLLRQLGSGNEPNRPKNPENTFRHYDHKFEWTRMEFAHWVQTVGEQYGYSYQLDGVGHLPGSELYGPCTQIAIFTRQQSRATDRIDGDLSCFDLLLNKLSVEERAPEFIGDRQLQRICLMGAFKIPAGLKENQVAPERQIVNWDALNRDNEAADGNKQEDDETLYYDDERDQLDESTSDQSDPLNNQDMDSEVEPASWDGPWGSNPWVESPPWAEPACRSDASWVSKAE